MGTNPIREHHQARKDMVKSGLIRQTLGRAPKSVRKGHLRPVNDLCNALEGITSGSTPILFGNHAVSSYPIIKQNGFAVVGEDSKKVALSRVWFFREPSMQGLWQHREEAFQ
ncbi:MAG: hypothetical protein AA931_11910 [Peptococcaceae bacterium 1109]|nr:MAG: hypothetical protein AA931_11910 [Peptococcaceae bacterium 1109]